MHFSTAAVAALTTTAFAAATTRADCHDYVLISTRGTGEEQGECVCLV